MCSVCRHITRRIRTVRPLAVCLVITLTAYIQAASFPISFHGYGTCEHSTSFEVAIILDDDDGTHCMDIRVELLPFAESRLAAPQPVVIERASVPYTTTPEGDLEVNLPMIGKARLQLADDRTFRVDTADFAGRQWSLVLKRIQHVTLTSPPRPQLAEPRHWHSEEHVIIDRGAGVTLAGSLYLPIGNGPFPTVVVVQGSESVSRPWSNSADLVIASTLAKAGIASFFYDDRGTGRSTGDKQGASYEDSVGDVVSITRALRENKMVDGERISLLGVSEGSIIVAMAAPMHNYRNVILLSPPTASPAEFMRANLAEAAKVLTRSGKLPSDASQLGLAQLFVDAFILGIETRLPAADIAAMKISALSDNEKSVWDLKRLEPYLSQTIEAVRSLNMRQRSFYLMDIGTVYEKAADSNSKVLAIVGTRDVNPLCGNPDALKLIFAGRPRARVVAMSINHGLIDYEDIGSAHEFDVKQIISSRVLNQLVDTLSE